MKYYFSLYIINRLFKLWIWIASLAHIIIQKQEVTNYMRWWEPITYSVRYTISPIMLPGDTVNSDSIELLSFMIYTDSDSSVFLAIYPLHCPIDSRVWPQTFAQCFCQLRADLEIFWLEIRWSKSTIRISPLKSTGLGSWQMQCSSFLNFTK